MKESGLPFTQAGRQRAGCIAASNWLNEGDSLSLGAQYTFNDSTTKFGIGRYRER